MIFNNKVVLFLKLFIININGRTDLILFQRPSGESHAAWNDFDGQFQGQQTHSLCYC